MHTHKFARRPAVAAECAQLNAEFCFVIPGVKYLLHGSENWCRGARICAQMNAIISVCWACSHGIFVFRNSENVCTEN